MMKNDITYEYRVFTHRLIDVETMEVGKCTSKVIKELKPKDKIDGRFFHTSDTDEWFFCWNGEIQKLNLKGDSDVNAAIAEVEKLIADANVAVEVAKTTAKEAKEAADIAKNAADAANTAVENIENKADKTIVDALSEKIDAIKIPSLDGYAKLTDIPSLDSYAKLTDIPSLDGYATENFVSEEIAKIEIPEVPTKVSELENDSEYLTTAVADLKYAPIGSEGVDLSNYATKDYVSEEIAKIEIPEVPTKISELENDSNFLTETDITGKQDVIGDLNDIRSGASLGATALQSIPEEYVTETELEGKGYLTTAVADSKYAPIGSGNYATQDFVKSEIEKINIPTVPTNVSAFTNDAGYLTEHQDLSEYALKSELPTVPTKVSELENNLNFLTKADADEYYAAIGSTGSGVAKDYVDTELAKKQNIIDDIEDIRTNAALAATALQSIPDEYVTETELEGKGYLTEQDISGKQDVITDLNDIRANATKGATALQSLDNYFTKDEINDLIGEAVNITNTILA